MSCKVYIMRGGNPDGTPVGLDILNDIASAENPPPFVGLGTKQQDAAVVRLVRGADYAMCSWNELDVEIEEDGSTYVILDGHELRHDLGVGWVIDGRPIDDLETAIRLLLEKRRET